MNNKHLEEVIKDLDFGELQLISETSELSEEEIILILNKVFFFYKKGKKSHVNFWDYYQTVINLLYRQKITDKIILKYQDLFLHDGDFIETLLKYQKLSVNVLEKLLVKFIDNDEENIILLFLYNEDTTLRTFIKHPSIFHEVMKVNSTIIISCIINTKKNNTLKKINKQLLYCVSINYIKKHL